ncbi:type VI secretion system-associated FHA domain protein TagH [Paraglaciecola arctica]|uniref:Type VI secretion system protein n=1 Tax=Paraglaciecola arctica BSs20135 TaxID=493475 RepID=K6YCP5_9ALTE|nr:type VI secretion system-associated FHA domain protein TagH [Paraglaciecola arctica]GAC21716.1 type VI secretion system protein [Paraglaciecola arctica BSs20135]
MPYLKLKIVSGSETGQNDNVSFSHLGGSIGRSEDCDWTLIDSDRFVSKKHLVITFRNQQFILTDVSSNGVIINNAREPLGRGNEHIFQATDTLIIGKHVVKVEDIKLDVEDANANPFQTQHDDGDLFSLIMGGDSTPEPMQEPQTPQKIPDTSDLFKDVEQDSGLGLGEILSTPIKSPAANEFTDFNEQSNPFNINPQPTTPQSASFESHDINTNVKSDEILIPDDWEMFDSISTTGNLESPIEINTPETHVATEEHIETHQQNNIPAAAIHQSARELLPENNPAIIDEEPVVKPQLQPQQTNPQTSDNINKKVTNEEISNTTNDDFFTTLYEKLGLSKEFKATINQEVFAEDIATILLSTTQGLMSLLASRTAFKQESRMSATLIQPKSNNPIKFSIDPVDTLEMLLVKKKKGYMSVENSYDEAMEDIQLHQMAFMSGLQGTLDGVLGQLAPEDIEKEVNKKSQMFKGLNSNSQCWKIYKEKQPLLAKRVKENLNEVLGTYFSDSYQSHINRYKNENKKEKAC